MICGQLLEADRAQLKTLQDRNAQLENEVDRFNERKKIEDEVRVSVSAPPSHLPSYSLIHLRFLLSIMLADVVLAVLRRGMAGLIDRPPRAPPLLHTLHGSPRALHRSQEPQTGPTRPSPTAREEERADVEA